MKEDPFLKGLLTGIFITAIPLITALIAVSNK